jgi:hypothetical protein
VNLVSDHVFDVFNSAAVGGLAGVWLLYDLRNLVKVRREDGRAPLVRDRVFGYAIGMVIGAVGLTGVVLHYR